MAELIERYSISQNTGLQATIQRMKETKSRITLEMRQLYSEMKVADTINAEKLNRYLYLNEELRKVSIFEAEFTYLKNII